MNIIGGCCGTTTDHLKAVVDRLARQEAGGAHADVPARLRRACKRSQELIVDQQPLLVGERTNTNGSRKFKQLLEKEDWHGLVEMARSRSARAFTSSTCAWTTSAATACAT